MSKFGTAGGAQREGQAIARKLKLACEPWEYLEDLGGGHTVYSLVLPWEQINRVEPTSDDDPGSVTMTCDQFDQFLAMAHALGYEEASAEMRESQREDDSEIIELLKKRSRGH